MKHEAPHLLLGKKAEKAACDYLRGEGYRILECGWRRPWGELDIIAQYRDVIHFIEVKAQRKLHTGFEAHLRAGHTKLEKVIRTSRSWLAASQHQDTPWQIDIIEVTMGEQEARIRHFVNVTA